MLDIPLFFWHKNIFEKWTAKCWCIREIYGHIYDTWYATWELWISPELDHYSILMYLSRPQSCSHWSQHVLSLISVTAGSGCKGPIVLGAQHLLDSTDYFISCCSYQKYIQLHHTTHPRQKCWHSSGINFMYLFLINMLKRLVKMCWP